MKLLKNLGSTRLLFVVTLAAILSWQLGGYCTATGDEYMFWDCWATMDQQCIDIGAGDCIHCDCGMVFIYDHPDDMGACTYVGQDWHESISLGSDHCYATCTGSALSRCLSSYAPYHSPYGWETSYCDSWYDYWCNASTDCRYICAW